MRQKARLQRHFAILNCKPFDEAAKSLPLANDVKDEED